jgi:Zn-dependent protease with chaperone function
MFAARGIAVSLSTFVIVYCALSVAITCGSRQFRAWRRVSARRTADLLFALRLFPLITAAVVTAVFTTPSFLLLEPRTIDEPLGKVSLALGAFALTLGVIGMLNTATAMHRASRVTAEWTQGARSAKSLTSIPVLRVSPVWPAMTVTGILHPRILLSRAAELRLTDNELQAALNHELAHVRFGDNLKKLVMRFVVFPGMRRLENAWLEAIEYAADDAAVGTTRDALDLAAALIKLSRGIPPDSIADFTIGLLKNPPSTVCTRVERLLVWAEEGTVEPPKRYRWQRVTVGFIAMLALLTTFAITYNDLLVRVHTATEWLVR